MFLSTVMLPAVANAEVHRHLHHLFDAKERCFLYRDMGAGEYLVLSTIPPRHPHRVLDLSSVASGRPLSFAADLAITKEGERAKIDIRSAHERRAWLKRQLDGIAELRYSDFQDGVIFIKGGLKRIIAKTTGVIEITDRARFAARMQFGFGRHKAYGCGLLYIPEIMR